MKDITENCGSTLIQYNNNSYTNLITNFYSNYNWLPWKFVQTPRRYWNDMENVKEYMNWLSEQLNIKTMEDWYNVTYEVITEKLI